MAIDDKKLEIFSWIIFVFAYALDNLDFLHVWNRKKWEDFVHTAQIDVSFPHRSIDIILSLELFVFERRGKN